MALHGCLIDFKLRAISERERERIKGRGSRKEGNVLNRTVAVGFFAHGVD